MKIQLVTTEAPVQTRTPFRACPLCEAQDPLLVREVEANGDPLAGASVPERWNWMGCQTCGHLFAEGYFEGEAQAELIERTWEAPVQGPAIEAQRRIAGNVVHRIAELRGTPDGVWLDVGFGSGALLTTAQEFGYEAMGIELSNSLVEWARDQGIEAQCATIDALEGEQLFDVISFNDLLPNLPFPGQALQAAGRLLRPGGLIYIAAPNVDSQPWREMEREGDNPNWGRADVYHHFSREHMYWLLRRSGFEPCDYRVSEAGNAGMQVCAVLKSDV